MRVAVQQTEAGVRFAIELVKGRWTIPILLRLCVQPTHFAELQREVGLSAKVLADALVRMCDHGLVTRQAPERAGLKGLYRLTPAGDALRAPLQALAEWSLEYELEIRGVATSRPSDKAHGTTANQKVTG
jgi:DNA-binding HxlR family transcriptional regulator